MSTETTTDATKITVQIYDNDCAGRRNIEFATDDGQTVHVITGADLGDNPDPIVGLSLTAAVQVASSLVEMIAGHLGDAAALLPDLSGLAAQAGHVDRLIRQINA